MPDKYLKILLGALLVEVALALVFQFKTLDVTTLPQQLEKEIMAGQMPLKQPGATITVKDKLQRLIEVYQSQATSEDQLASCQNELAVAKKQLEVHDCTTLSFDLCSEIRNLFSILQVPLKKCLPTRTSGHCSISPWQNMTGMT